MLKKVSDRAHRRARRPSSIAACSEKLDAGRSCPLLCPQQAISLRDTTIDAVVTDTTIAGLPPIGNETYLMLASHGDTLDTRVIIRFDTLPQTYTKSDDRQHHRHRSTRAMLVVPIVKPDSLHRPKAPVTIEVYNVDTTATDTVGGRSSASLFRPDRLLGSKTFAPESLLDTLRIPISTRHGARSRARTARGCASGFGCVSTPGYDLRIGITSNSVPR